MKTIYYVYKNEKNIPKRVAKKEGAIWYGFEKNKWKEMPELAKIEWDITDYQEISKEEAEKFISWQKENWDKVIKR